jgi:hypothetical protein
MDEEPSPSPTRVSAKPAFRAAWVAALLLAVWAVGMVGRTPYSASGLRLAPDEVEYALSAHRLVEVGRYEIRVDGKWLPPRYPPWFAALVLAPTYLIVGGEVGNAILAVTLFAALGVLTAFWIGRRIGGIWGGVLAGIGVMALPIYRAMAGLVMTDVPSATLTLVAAGLFMTSQADRSLSLRRCIGVGCLVAFAFSLRVTNAALILPFAYLAATSEKPAAALRRWLCLGAPMLIVAGLNLACNATFFGSPWRSGYRFWCSVPYDYSAMVMSLGYLTTNLQVLALQFWPVTIGLAIAGLLTWGRPDCQDPQSAEDSTAARALLLFAVISGVPIVAFYLLYFFPEARFYLGPLVLLTALTGGLIGMRLQRLPVAIPLLILGLLCVGTWGWRAATPPKSPAVTRVAADQVLQHTPDNAWIISAFPPAYIEYMAGRQSTRRFIPASRNVEYASKLLVPQRIDAPNPPPETWYDHRCAGMLAAGAEEAVKVVGTTNFDVILAAIERGVPMYLLSPGLGEGEAALAEAIEQHLEVVPVTKILFALHPRRPDSDSDAN